MTDFEGAI